MLGANNYTYAQKPSFIGLNFTVENSSGNLRPGLGVFFEKKITRHSGFVTGIFYRNYILDAYLIVADSTGSRSYPIVISEKYLSVPILYKFHNHILNLSIGPTFDFYLGWRQKNLSSLIKVDKHSIHPKLSMGMLTKVSKKINLNRQFSLEPELRFNYIFTNDRSYTGFGIAGKYQLK